MPRSRARGYYSGFDDLPPDAREVVRESVWLGMLQYWQIRQIPRTDAVADRLRAADRLLRSGSNVSGEFPWGTAQRMREILFLKPRF